jgi:hypothetical protein
VWEWLTNASVPAQLEQEKAALTSWGLPSFIRLPFGVRWLSCIKSETHADPSFSKGRPVVSFTSSLFQPELAKPNFPNFNF